MFYVICEYPSDGATRHEFRTEREARAWINDDIDAQRMCGLPRLTYSLYDDDGLIVRSAFPVLMVA